MLGYERDDVAHSTITEPQTTSVLGCLKRPGDVSIVLLRVDYCGFNIVGEGELVFSWGER